MLDSTPMTESSASPENPKGVAPTPAVTGGSTPNLTPDPVSEDVSKVEVASGFGNSGVQAGVEDGLSFVHRNPTGTIPAQMESHGPDSRQACVTEAAGEKFGKNFEFRS